MAEPRQFRIRCSLQAAGYYWRCRWCPSTDGSYGWAGTIAEAADAAKKHVPNCPRVIDGANRLLDEILALPEYRPLALGVAGVGLIAAWACPECGRIFLDPDQHTARHLDDRDRARGAERG